MKPYQDSHSQVNESNSFYNRIRFFNSFEEAEEANFKECAMRSPLQRLTDTTALIKRTFREELEMYPTIGNRINFMD